jgi:isoleucyl-tRNA synthetase
MDYKATVNLPKTDFPMRANLTANEPASVARWKKMGLYQLLRRAGADRPRYVLHDGPPYANGDLHMGHALNKVLKDLVVRSKQMSGYDAPYVPGWDCHGLPIEYKVLNDLGAEAKSLSKVEIRKRCREFALGIVDVHRNGFERLEINGDWPNPYLTLNPTYVATAVRVFGEMYQLGQIYKGSKPIYWCFSCETALAEAEVEYANHISPSVYVKFPLIDPLPGVDGPVSMVIWTTTPWTLPANLAISVHPDFDYTAVKIDGETLIMADYLAPHALSAAGIEQYTKVAAFKGADLEGLKYRHALFSDRICPVILGEHVTLEAGTGCVHTAPGHGQEDYVVGARYGIAPFSPVDGQGRFTAEAGPYAGMQVFEANKRIVEDLKASGALLHTSKIEHSYAHCWRCMNPVIYRATPQWFISLDNNGLREKAVQGVNSVEWVPAWGQERIRGMIEQRPDWCISRQRAWGVPIPVFYCKDCEEPVATPETIGAVEQLALSAADGIDRWFDTDAAELLPKGTKCPKCGGTSFTKETDILDVWFDSGVSNRAVCEGHPDLSWPVDMYLEGSDQHRGWFQSSLLPAVAVKGVPPYRTVVTHGYVVDGDGKKLSKKLGNFVELSDIVNQLGADIIRLWVTSENYRQDIRISDEILKRLQDAYRRLRNTFRYILGNLSDFTEANAVPYDELEDVDRWALHQLQDLVLRARKGYETYEFHQVFHGLYNFCAVDLSSFYFDILKDRLYTFAQDSRERRAAQTVLAETATVLLRLLAPVIPHTTDEAWQCLPEYLRTAESVHLTQFPEVNEAYVLPEEKLQGWNELSRMRGLVSKVLEDARRAGVIGASLEASVILTPGTEDLENILRRYEAQLPWVFIVSNCEVHAPTPEAAEAPEQLLVRVERAPGEKCVRCWNYRDSVGKVPDHPEICSRCAKQLETWQYEQTGC